MKSAQYKVEKRCRICSKKKLLNLINLGNQPLANRLNSKIPKKDLKFPLNLCMCKDCKTVQIKETVFTKGRMKSQPQKTLFVTRKKGTVNPICNIKKRLF